MLRGFACGSAAPRGARIALMRAMKPVVRTALALAASALMMFVLDAVARRRGVGRGSLTRKILAVVRPLPVADDTVAERVRKRLARVATDPGSILVSIEHGCVDLRGPVPTRERPQIVRAIATVPGVDAVVDLMTEQGQPARFW